MTATGVLSLISWSAVEELLYVRCLRLAKGARNGLI